MTSLSVRLSLILAALFFSALAVSGWLVFSSVRGQTEGDATAQAVSIAKSVERRIAENGDGQHADIRDGDALAGVPAGVPVAIRAADGTVINKNTANTIPAGTGDRLIGGSRYWVVRWPLPKTAGDSLWIAVPFESQTRFLELLRSRLMAIGWATGVLTLATAFLVVRRRLHPLTDLARAVREFGSGDWGRRYPLRGPADEVRVLGATFNQMAETVEDTLARQRAFIADASHELRTPVAIIDGFVRMVQRWAKSDPQALDEALAAMATETSHMKRLLVRLLQSGGEPIPKHTTIRPLRLDELTRQVTDSASLLGRERHVEVRCDTLEPVTIFADPEALREVLLVLLDNAIKFSPDGGCVTVSCHAAVDFGEVRVRDEGPGIDEDALPHIFDRFYRADPSRSRHVAGSGLGLSIAREIMAAQGGAVGVEKTGPDGSVFLISVPTSG